MNALKSVCFLVCLVTGLAHADPEMDRLKTAYESALERVDAPVRAAYVKELDKLLQHHAKTGNLDAALVVRKEIESLTGKPYQEAAPGGNQVSPQTELERLFVDKTWRTPTGTRFTFHPGGVGMKVIGKTEKANTSWRHRSPNLVEVTAGKESWYFRFVSITEAYFGRNKDDINQKLQLD
jgi:hypothetical protein